MSKQNPLAYYREEREMTQEHQKAVNLLTQAGEIAKEYSSELLGSFSFHICSRYNPLTGKGELSVAKLATELNISQEVAKAVAEIVRDESLALLGMKMLSAKPLTKDERAQSDELQKEIKALAAEQGIH